MNHRLAAVAAMMFALALAMPTAAQDLASQVVGVWKLKSWESAVVGSEEKYRTFGEKPTGYLIFTKGGRLVNVIFGTDRKPPAGPLATEAESMALLKSLVATTGTYKMEGGKIVLAFDGSANQAMTGTNAIREVTIMGGTMTFKSMPFVSPVTGKTIVFTAILDRVE